MHVKCAQCSAVYDFPVAQLPEAGLRAKCASCGYVMMIKPEEAPRPGRALSQPPAALAAADADLLVAPKRPSDGSLTAPRASAPPAAASAEGDDMMVAPKRPSGGLTLPPGAPRAPDAAADAMVDVRSDEVVRRRGGGNPKGIRIDPSADAGKPRRGGGARTSEVRNSHHREPDPDQPKVIVDIGQLSESSAPAAVAPEPSPPPADRAEAAFAPLSTPAAIGTSALEEAARVAPTAAPESFQADEPADVKAIKPPGLGWVAFVFVLLVLGGAFAFVWWRNDWAPIWDDPALALDVALGSGERPVAAPPAQPVVETASVQGQLEITDVRMELVPVGRKDHVALVHGRLTNGTNRVQRGITLEAILEDAPEGLPLKTRVAACCDVFDAAQAAEVARTPAHPHFANLNRAAASRLMPGESRPFSIILIDLDDDLTQRALHPAVKVRFAEAERAHR